MNEDAREASDTDGNGNRANQLLLSQGALAERRACRTASITAREGSLCTALGEAILRGTGTCADAGSVWAFKLPRYAAIKSGARDPTEAIGADLGTGRTRTRGLHPPLRVSESPDKTPPPARGARLFNADTTAVFTSLGGPNRA